MEPIKVTVNGIELKVVPKNKKGRKPNLSAFIDHTSVGCYTINFSKWVRNNLLSGGIKVVT